MKRLLATLALVAVAAGCATVPEQDDVYAPKVAADPNPYANYGAAMRPVPALPMAVEWHNANADALARETSVEALEAAMPKNAKEADELLAQVKGDYASDPMVLTKIAALSQLAMCRKWDKAPAAREIWTCALLRAAERAPDAYRAMFYLDQLRWCGKSAQAAKVLAIGGKASDPHVAEFAAMVAAEIMAIDKRSAK